MLAGQRQEDQKKLKASLKYGGGVVEEGSRVLTGSCS